MEYVICAIRFIPLRQNLAYVEREGCQLLKMITLACRLPTFITSVNKKSSIYRFSLFRSSLFSSFANRVWSASWRLLYIRTLVHREHIDPTVNRPPALVHETTTCHLSRWSNFSVPHVLSSRTIYLPTDSVGNFYASSWKDGAPHRRSKLRSLRCNQRWLKGQNS